MKLDRTQRSHIANMLKDSANITLGSFVIGQIVERAAQLPLVLIGVVYYLIIVVVSTSLQKGV